MQHEQSCVCVICDEWDGREPNGWLSEEEEQQTYQMIELPDPFDEVLGG